MINRPWKISARLSEEEKQRMKAKMDEMGIENQSLYIRKMILDGYCVHLDTKSIKEMVYLLRMCSNNLNQYAKKANGYGTVYAADIKDIKTRLDEIWEQAKDILVELAAVQ